jgi:prepilin-type N-terminal cleavage/methylation domain-containing protein
MPTRSSRARGFTLVELVVVVLLVGLMMGVALTRLDYLVPKYRLRAGAREVAAVLKQGRARAVASGKDVYFEVDLSRGTYGLLVAFPPVDDHGREVEGRALEYGPVFQRALPDGVQFVDVIFSEKERATSGRARVRLSPLGSSQHLVVNLRNTDRKDISFRLNGFTGGVAFHDERREADALLEDAGP